MRAPHAGYLADPGTTRLTVERMWFEREPDLAASAERFDRLPRDPEGVTTSFLASRSRPIDAGILRGTKAAEPSNQGREALVVATSVTDAPPTLPSWEPVGTVRRAAPISYRQYRTYLADGRDPDDATLAVAVEIHFTPDAAHRRAAWVDLVLAAIQGDPATPAGLISAQFHLSDDASHVLNLALWTTEADYDAALESGPPGIAQTDTEAWQAVRTFDGIVRNVVTRYSARRSAP
jgi:hypothetical protein